MSSVLIRGARGCPTALGLTRRAAGVSAWRTGRGHASAVRQVQQRLRLRASFNPNDPATWGESATAGAEPELQTLSDADLFQLLNAPAELPPTPAQARPSKDRAPEDAAGAIALGLKLFRDDPSAARALFVAALDLPGSGPRRVKGKPAELSTGELQAALYNAACCSAKLGDVAAGLDFLRAAVEAGFDDWDALRKGDADLAPLRSAPGAEWGQFVARLPAAKAPPQSFLGGLFGR